MAVADMIVLSNWAGFRVWSVGSGGLRGAGCVCLRGCATLSLAPGTHRAIRTSGVGGQDEREKKSEVGRVRCLNPDIVKCVPFASKE